VWSADFKFYFKVFVLGYIALYLVRPLVASLKCEAEHR